MRERISETYHELININDFPLLYSQLSGRKTLSSLLVAIIDSIPLLPLQRGEGGGGWGKQEGGRGGWGKQEGGKVMVLRTLASHQYLGGFYATPEVALSGNSQLTAERIPQ